MINIDFELEVKARLSEHNTFEMALNYFNTIREINESNIETWLSNDICFFVLDKILESEKTNLSYIDDAFENIFSYCIEQDVFIYCINKFYNTDVTDYMFYYFVPKLSYKIQHSNFEYQEVYNFILNYADKNFEITNGNEAILAFLVHYANSNQIDRVFDIILPMYSDNFITDDNILIALFENKTISVKSFENYFDILFESNKNKLLSNVHKITRSSLFESCINKLLDNKFTHISQIISNYLSGSIHVDYQAIDFILTLDKKPVILQEMKRLRSNLNQSIIIDKYLDKITLFEEVIFILNNLSISKKQLDVINNKYNNGLLTNIDEKDKRQFENIVLIYEYNFELSKILDEKLLDNFTKFMINHSNLVSFKENRPFYDELCKQYIDINNKINSITDKNEKKVTKLFYLSLIDRTVNDINI